MPNRDLTPKEALLFLTPMALFIVSCLAIIQGYRLVGIAILIALGIVALYSAVVVMSRPSNMAAISAAETAFYRKPFGRVLRYITWAAFAWVAFEIIANWMGQ